MVKFYRPWSYVGAPRRRRGFRRRRQPAIRRQLSFMPTGHYVDRQYHDFNLGATSFTNTMAYGNLNVLPYLPAAPGGQRATERVMNRSIQWSYTVAPGSAQVINQVVRILIIYDKQCNGADPASPLPLTAASVYAFKDPGYRERFQILRDFTLQVTPQTAAPLTGVTNYQGAKHAQVQTGYLKISLPTQFNNGVAGTIADISTGSLLLCLLGDTAAGMNTTPVINGFWRVVYSQLGRH